MTSSFACEAVERVATPDHNRGMAPRVQTPSQELRRPAFIKAWRKKAGLTLEKLAQAIEERTGYVISDGQLSRIERGETACTLDLLEAVAITLGLSDRSVLLRPPQEADPDEAVILLRQMNPNEKRRALAMLRLLKTGAEET